MKIRSPLLLVLLTTVLGGCNITTSTTPTDQYVQVSGNGEVEAVANRFRINAAASDEGMDISALKAGVDHQIDEAVRRLNALGIDSKDIRALALQVQPKWQWKPERQLIGYQARREMSLDIKGLDNYTDVLQALTDVGLGDIQPAGSSVANEDELGDQALQLAVDNARHKAELLAKRAGRKLGPALSIVETGASSNPIRPMMMDARAKTESFYNPGTSTIDRHVEVRFRLD